MTTLPPGNTPLIVFRTGAAGIVEGVTVAIYTGALIVYYVGPYLYADVSSYGTAFAIFYIWAAFKTILPVLAAIYTTLQVFTIGPIIGYIIFASLIALGSLGFFITLVIDLAARCNQANNPGLACNDPLFCCAFWNETSQCSGLGPCPGSGVSSGQDLRVSENHRWLTWFTLSLFLVEILIAVLAYLVYQRRVIKARRARVLIDEAIREKYGSGSVPVFGGEETTAVETINGDNNNNNNNEGNGFAAVNSRIGSKLGIPQSDATRMYHYQSIQQLPWWQARIHSAFDWMDDWMDWANYHLNTHVARSIGWSLLTQEHDDMSVLRDVDMQSYFSHSHNLAHQDARNRHHHHHHHHHEGVKAGVNTKAGYHATTYMSNDNNYNDDNNTNTGPPPPPSTIPFQLDQEQEQATTTDGSFHMPMTQSEPNSTRIRPLMDQPRMNNSVNIPSSSTIDELRYQAIGARHENSDRDWVKYRGTRPNSHVQ